MADQKTCRCDAYAFPHRHLSGKCGAQAELRQDEIDEANRYYADRGVRDIDLYESGMKNSDFG